VSLSNRCLSPVSSRPGFLFAPAYRSGTLVFMTSTRFLPNKKPVVRTNRVTVSAEQGAERPRPGDEAEAMSSEPGTVEELFHAYASRLYRAAFMLSGGPERAEALVQETFAAAVEAWPRFEHRSRAYTWLYSILLRRARRRRQQADRRLDTADVAALPSRSPNPVEQVELGEQTTVLMESLGQLPAEASEVLVLFYLESMRYREIAEALGVPIGTVKSRLHAAKRVLAARLRERGIEL